MKTNRGISMRSQNGSNNIDFNLEPNTNAGMLFARNVASGQAPVQVLPGTSGKQVYGFEAPHQKMFDVVDAISTSGGGSFLLRKRLQMQCAKLLGQVTWHLELHCQIPDFLQVCLFCCLKNIISCFIL